MSPDKQLALDGSQPSEGFAIETVPVASLQVAEPFASLFPIDPEDRGRILRSMREGGYDPKQPLQVWRTSSALVVTDGHTRLDCAKELRIEEVPCSISEHADEHAARVSAIRSQTNRRQLGRKQAVMHAARLLGDVDAGGITAAEVADILGVSKGSIDQLRVVRDHDQDDLLGQVAAGTQSLREAYDQATKRRAPSTQEFVQQTPRLQAPEGFEWTDEPEPRLVKAPEPPEPEPPDEDEDLDSGESGYANLSNSELDEEAENELRRYRGLKHQYDASHEGLVRYAIEYASRGWGEGESASRCGFTLEEFRAARRALGLTLRRPRPLKDVP